MGNKPHISQTSNKVVNFSLATNEWIKDQKGNNQQITNWHNIKAFHKLADFALEYLDNGSFIEIQGRLKTDKYENKNGDTKYSTYILADEILLLDKKSGSVE